MNDHDLEAMIRVLPLRKVLAVAAGLEREEAAPEVEAKRSESRTIPAARRTK